MRRRRLKKATPAGPKKGGPGGQIRPPGGPISRPRESQTTSWGVLGARSASGGRSGREKVSWKIVWRALGTVLGPSWRLLGQFRVAFPPQGRARGRSRRSFLKYFGVIFGNSLGAQAEKLNMIIFQVLLCLLGSVLYSMYCPLLPSLLRGRRRRAHAKILKFNWFLWVASHMRLFLAAPEAIEFQRTRVANIE